MLSRAALLALQRPVASVAVRASSSAAATGSAEWPRPVRRDQPGAVRLGFIPEEWFTFFYNKTGVTGPYTFGVGLLTYLCSKEIYVMEHEYYSGLSLAIMCVVGVKKLGPALADYCDKEIDRIEGEWKQGREDDLANLAQQIKDEELEQWRADGQALLMQAKKENVSLQLEAAYRERLAAVYGEVKKRLDYQVKVQHVEREMNQKHQVAWVIDNVLKSITESQEKETLNKCIDDLSGLAANVPKA